MCRTIPPRAQIDQPGRTVLQLAGEPKRRHRAYLRRVMLGPSYRADMWAELESDPSLPPAELARRAYGSFATAWQVRCCCWLSLIETMKFSV